MAAGFERSMVLAVARPIAPTDPSVAPLRGPFKVRAATQSHAGRRGQSEVAGRRHRPEVGVDRGVHRAGHRPADGVSCPFGLPGRPSRSTSWRGHALGANRSTDPGWPPSRSGCRSDARHGISPPFPSVRSERRPLPSQPDLPHRPRDGSASVRRPSGADSSTPRTALLGLEAWIVCVLMGFGLLEARAARPGPPPKEPGDPALVARQLGVGEIGRAAWRGKG